MGRFGWHYHDLCQASFAPQHRLVPCSLGGRGEAACLGEEEWPPSPFVAEDKGKQNPKSRSEAP